MAKYKVRDKVKVKKGLEVGKYYGGCFFIEDMKKLEGLVTEISYVEEPMYRAPLYRIEGDQNRYLWTERILEDIPAAENPAEDEEDILFLEPSGTPTRSRRELYIQRIRSLSTDKLVEMIMSSDCDFCPVDGKFCCSIECMAKDCEETIRRWLNEDGEI